MGTKKRYKGIGVSQVYVVMSTALVLFLVGISFLFFLHGRKMINKAKESIEFSVILKDTTSESIYKALESQVMTRPYIDSIEYVTKEEAKAKYIKEFGDDFSEMLPYNPLYYSLNIKMKAAYVNEDSINKIRAQLEREPVVGELYYDKQQVALINNNIRKVTLAVVALSLLLLLITATLIDSTTRLAMYSNRFTIRSMQLVGATRWFILKPFIGRGIINGIISGLIGVAALATLLNLVINFIPDLSMLQDVPVTLTLFGLVLLVGILFSVISTYFAVIRYLKMNLNDLY